MIITILVSFGIAKLKKWELKKLFREYTLYPFFLLELIHFIFQISMFCGVTVFLPFAPFLKIAFMVSLLFPFFRYRFYTMGAIGAGCVFIGTLLNKIVMNANQGKMPVFPSLSYWTGYTKPELFSQPDGLHILGSVHTKLNFLADWIDVGYSVLSIGDLFIRLYVVILLDCTIACINKSEVSKIES